MEGKTALSNSPANSPVPHKQQRDCKSILCEKISSQIPAWRARVKRLLKDHGSFRISDVTIEQIYSGIRGVQIQVSDISYVDPQEGIRIRGYSIPELLEQLPRAEGTEYPLIGGLYYLLLANEMPTFSDAMMVEAEWRRRSKVPAYVFDVIRALPDTTHPMTLFSTAILAMQNESVFAREYAEGISKPDYWESYLEDSLNLTARLPEIAAFIYNLKFRGGVEVAPDPNRYWSANFANMIGLGDNLEYQELARLFFLLHSDHEGGNVSAHTAHLVSSALSDVYQSCSAAMNGLAGPLHGLANQECLRWLLDTREEIGDFPTRERLRQYLEEYLASGRVIPGYGHAVLRKTDPRFTAQLDFGKRHMPDDDLFQFVNLIYEELPPILLKQGKVKNPWPNVDAINGTMQYHYGVTQFDFYTVLFGVSRILGLTAHIVWARALNKPIERPKSLTTQMLEEMVEEAGKA